MSDLGTTAFQRRVTPHRGCPKCHDIMMLSVILPEDDGRARQTFECRRCGHAEMVMTSI
jgi:transcription elongation factor Elf1